MAKPAGHPSEGCALEHVSPNPVGDVLGRVLLANHRLDRQIAGPDDSTDERAGRSADHHIGVRRVPAGGELDADQGRHLVCGARDATASEDQAHLAHEP